MVSIYFYLLREWFLFSSSLNNPQFQVTSNSSSNIQNIKMNNAKKEKKERTLKFYSKEKNNVRCEIDAKSLKRRSRMKAWSLKSRFSGVLFFECEIFEQNLKHLILGTCNIFLNMKSWRCKKQKRKSQKSLSFFKKTKKYLDLKTRTIFLLELQFGFGS